MDARRRSRRDQPLQVESLEGLTLLSGLAASLAPTAAEITAAAARTVSLRAHAKGTFTTSHSLPDTGTTYNIVAKGATVGGARLSVKGDLQTPGFIAQGRTTGTLTVSTARGSLTLLVTGPLQPGFSPLPSKLGFTITGGTGIFAHNHSGSGTILLTDHVTSPSTSISPSGTISLVFRPGSSVV